MRLDDARPTPSTLTPASGGQHASASAASRNGSGFGFKLAWNDANQSTTTTTQKAYGLHPYFLIVRRAEVSFKDVRLGFASAHHFQIIFVKRRRLLFGI